MSSTITLPVVIEDKPELSVEQEETQSLLARLNSVSSHHDAEGYLEAMLDLIIQAAQAGSATYFCFDGQAPEAVITAVRGNMENRHLLGLRVKSGSEFINLNIPGAEIITAGELYDDPFWLRAANPRDAVRMQNLIILPVRTSQRNMGLIHIFNFQNANLTVLQLLADYLAHGLGQREELLQAHTQSRRLSRLLEAIGQMTGILDRNQLLHTVIEKASQLLEAERSTAFIVDPNTHETIYNVSYQAPRQVDLSLPTRNQLASDRPIRQAHAFNFLTTNAISVPLKNSVESVDGNSTGANLGGLMVLNKHAGVFQENDAQTLEVLADQASALLQVVELYESSEKLFLDAIKALSTAIDAKDPGTQGHSARVSDYSVLIAQEIGLDEFKINQISHQQSATRPG